MSQLISQVESFLSQEELDALLGGVTDIKSWYIIDELTIREETWYCIRVNNDIKSWILDNFDKDDFVEFPKENLKLLVTSAVITVLILKFNL
jgi:hypothetical protein